MLISVLGRDLLSKVQLLKTHCSTYIATLQHSSGSATGRSLPSDRLSRLAARIWLLKRPPRTQHATRLPSLPTRPDMLGVHPAKTRRRSSGLAMAYYPCPPARRLLPPALLFPRLPTPRTGCRCRLHLLYFVQPQLHRRAVKDLTTREHAGLRLTAPESLPLATDSGLPSAQGPLSP